MSSKYSHGMTGDDKWTAVDIPLQEGRVAVVTGANTGLGFETARMLAARRAEVVLACRNQTKADQAMQRIRYRIPEASLSTVPLDLADLASVRDAAEQIQRRYNRIDLIINNAGIMWAPRSVTKDGFESQLGINHLGHFAFTGLLADTVRHTPDARIVTVSSLAHMAGRVYFDDLQLERRYGRQRAYGQSKLANLLFTYQLQRRFETTGAEAIAVAAHPGLSRTELNRNGPGPYRVFDDTVGGLYLQSALMGALATLRAATDPHVRGGEYYGPGGYLGFRGYPTQVPSSKASHQLETAKRLWTVSAELTGVEF